jgi:DNA-binding CsgD family transcriptional regulator
LSASLAERIAATSPQCAAVLLTAALAATPTLQLLAAAHPDLDLEGAVAEADHLQIATVTDATHAVLRFSHPLLPVAAAELAGPVARATRHRLLAAVVDDPQQRALHLAAGTLRPDERIAAELATLGEELLVRAAPAEAAAAFRRAADLTPAADARDRRSLQAGSALVRAGDNVGAMAVLAPLAANSADPVVRATASVEVVLPTAHAGSIPDAARAADRALDIIPDPALRGQLLRWTVRLHQLVDGPAALTTAARAVEEARDAGDANLVHAAVGVLQNARAFAGEEVDLAAATAAADGWTDRFAADSPPAMLAELMQWCDLPAAAEWLQRYTAATTGSIGERRNVDGLMSSYLLRAGRWDEAEAMLRRIADDDALSATANLPFQLADLMWLGAQRGHVVDDLRAALLSMVGVLPPLASVQVRSRLGGAALAAGDVAAAAADLRVARALAAGMSLHSVRVLPFRLELVEALLAAGDVARATAEAEALGRDAERAALPSARAEAAAASGMVAATEHRATGALVHFDAALALYGALDLPFDEARVRLAAGVAARRQGKRTIAIAHLDAAVDSFRRLGAAPWAARALTERDRVGDRAVAKGALTPTEQRIAMLVAAGQTNAEVAAALFVSLRTVESNLTRVYRKLGVRSRVQLASKLHNT